MNKEEDKMPTCFVIQPFDSGKFDKRFDEIYKPALEQAGLDAYRVDRDPSVQVPIETIEERIRMATICLADITLDNPNVWYELGYAFAAGRNVILVCSERRSNKYPFDIQHRHVISYATESPSDHDVLRNEITVRARSLLSKSAARRIAQTEQVAPQEGLSQIELMVLAVAAGSTSVPGDSISAYSLKQEVENSGLTPVGYGVAISRLQRREFVTFGWDEESYGDPCPTVTISDVAWNWIADNERLFSVMKNDRSPSDFEDDIPF